MGNSFSCRNSRALTAITRFCSESVPASRCWSCRACTFDNKLRRSRCEMCGTRRDTSPQTNAAVMVSSVVPSRSSPTVNPPLPVSAALENALASIECPVCLEAFDDGAHAPCTLPACGHSFCLAHGSRITRCPICRKNIDSTTRRKLVKSITLVQAVHAISLLKDASVDAAVAVEDTSLEHPSKTSVSHDRGDASSGYDVAKEIICSCERDRRMCCKNSRAFPDDEHSRGHVGARHHGDGSRQQRRTSTRSHAGISRTRRKNGGTLEERTHLTEPSVRESITCGNKDAPGRRGWDDMMPVDEESPLKHYRGSSLGGSSCDGLVGSDNGISSDDGKHSRGGGCGAIDQSDDEHIKIIPDDESPIDEPCAEIRPCGHRCELSPSLGSCCNCVDMDRRLIGFLSNGRYARCKTWLEDSPGYDMYCNSCRERCKGEAPHTDSFLYMREIEG